MKKLTCLKLTCHSRHIVRYFPQLASSLISLSLRIPEAEDGSTVSYNDFSSLHRLTSLKISVSDYLDNDVTAATRWCDNFKNHPELRCIQLIDQMTSPSMWLGTFFDTVPITPALRIYESDHGRVHEWRDYLLPDHPPSCVVPT
jgi:hypothetical protein